MSEKFLNMLASAGMSANVGEFASFVIDMNCGFPKKSGLSHITKVVHITNAPIRRNYGKAVRYALKKKGAKHPDFQSQDSMYNSFVRDFINERNGKYYLQLVPLKNTKFATTYYENGKVVTDPEMLAAIKAEKDRKGYRENGAQAEAGLHGKDQILYKLYSLENVKVANIHHMHVVND